MPSLYALYFFQKLFGNSNDVWHVANKYPCQTIMAPTATERVSGKMALNDSIPWSRCFG